MGFYTGRTGHMLLNNKKVAKVRNWSLSSTVQLLSTNDISSVVDTFTPGVKGATGSATLIYYRLESGESETLTQFTDLLGRVMKGGAVETSDQVLLNLSVGPALEDRIEFYAYITQAEVSTSTGELAVVPFQFTVQGDFLDVIN
jgi:hypothetical protein